MPEIREFRPARTLNGLFDAYCKVCWCPVYIMWIDKEDPEGKCLYGCTAATDCPEAMGRARTAAQFAKLRAEGKLKPLPAPPTQPSGDES